MKRLNILLIITSVFAVMCILFASGVIFPSRNNQNIQDLRKTYPTYHRVETESLMEYRNTDTTLDEICKVDANAYIMAEVIEKIPDVKYSYTPSFSLDKIGVATLDQVCDDYVVRILDIYYQGASFVPLNKDSAVEVGQTIIVTMGDIMREEYPGFTVGQTYMIPLSIIFPNNTSYKYTLLPKGVYYVIDDAIVLSAYGAGDFSSLDGKSITDFKKSIIEIREQESKFTNMINAYTS